MKKIHLKLNILNSLVHYSLQETHNKEKIRENFLQDIDVVDSSLIHGFMKLWLYQYYVLARLSWPFLVYDFDKSFVLGLEKSAIKILKKWCGVGAKVDNGLLFRSKNNFGLGLTSIADHFERMQLVKCELLKNSVDESVRLLYSNRERLNFKLTRVWKVTNLSKIVNAEVNLNLQFPSQCSRAGLGFGNFNPKPSFEERRNLLPQKLLLFLNKNASLIQCR